MAGDPRYDRERVRDEREAVTEVRRPRTPPPWWRERWWIWGIVLLLFVGALIAFFALRDNGEEALPGKKTVPNVIGLREAEAVRRIEDRDLDADVERTASERPEGTVIEQNPGAGTELEAGDRVVVVVSEAATTVTETVTQTETVAPATVEVPDVVGEDHVSAGAQVDDAGLVANTYAVPSDELRGTVLVQNPDAGTKLPEGSSVRLNVALGPEPRRTLTVPDLTGMKAAEARDRCRRESFTCRTLERAAPGDVGDVVDQRPGAGTKAAELSQITLFVGR